MWGMATGAAHATPVDLQLVLAVDCSRSIDDDEFRLQVEGYAAAFRHPAVLKAIQSGARRTIAVTYMQWSGPSLQNQVVGWTLIDGPEAAADFADRLRAAPRTLFGGGTSLSGAIDGSRRLLATSGHESQRRTIDISGDGINNIGRRPEQARDEAVASGITINGLPILNEVGGLDEYFREFVVGGPGAFVIAAEDFTSFAAAILNKLIREIASDERYAADLLAAVGGAATP
ncbi:MAG: DUF1194 domain-containing protein [Rhodospirillales bacterium]|nr:DUF1194 domain-containing protein [Rhodospirillales bacterium]